MRNEADYDVRTLFSDQNFEGLGQIENVSYSPDCVLFTFHEFEARVSFLSESSIQVDVNKKGSELKRALETKGHWKYGETTESLPLSSGVTLNLLKNQKFEPEFRKEGKLLMSNFSHGEFEGTFRLGAEINNFLTFNKNSKQLKFSFTLPGVRGIYGVGESFNRFNKLGTEIATFSIDNNGHAGDGMYKAVPFFLSTGKVGIFVNTYSPVKFDFGAKLSNMIQITTPLEAVSFIVFTGTPKEILASYISLYRKPALPPKWSFGLWMSRWIGVAYQTLKEVEETLSKFQEYSIPVDVVAFDPQWLADYYPGLQVCEFQWDHQKFSTDHELGDYLKSVSKHLSLWVNPYVNLEGKIYAEAKDFLLKKEDGSVALVPDPDPFKRPPRGMYDFSNPEAFNFYKEKIRDLLVRSNADCVMTDFGETVPLAGKDYQGDHGIHVRNKLNDLYQVSAFEGAQAAEDDGMIWGRSGSIKSHALAVQWNGDSSASWEGMRNSLKGSLSYLTSGALFTAFDIPGTGGLIGEKSEKQSEEQYCRWVELGCLFSHLKIHGSIPEPWYYGEEAIRVFRKYMQLRYSLLPYIWNEAKVSVEESVPLIRTLVVEFPDDFSVSEIDDEYMFGSSVLIAPMFDESRGRYIYLPKGEWIDFWNRQKYNGGQWIYQEVPVDYIPIFVRRGAAIPMFKGTAENIEDLQKNQVETVRF